MNRPLMMKTLLIDLSNYTVLESSVMIRLLDEFFQSRLAKRLGDSSGRE